MFEVILAPEAAAFYATADRPLARKLAHCLRQLEQEPRRHNNIKRLSGAYAGRYRIRAGDWRIIYRIDDAASSVYVLSIAHRREIYD
jgi:mRNA interferase RelE/StbE